MHLSTNLDDLYNHTQNLISELEEKNRRQQQSTAERRSVSPSPVISSYKEMRNQKLQMKQCDRVDSDKKKSVLEDCFGKVTKLEKEWSIQKKDNENSHSITPTRERKANTEKLYFRDFNRDASPGFLSKTQRGVESGEQGAPLYEKYNSNEGEFDNEFTPKKRLGVKMQDNVLLTPSPGYAEESYHSPPLKYQQKVTHQPQLFAPENIKPIQSPPPKTAHINVNIAHLENSIPKNKQFGVTKSTHFQNSVNKMVNNQTEKLNLRKASPSPIRYERTPNKSQDMTHGIFSNIANVHNINLNDSFSNEKNPVENVTAPSDEKRKFLQERKPGNNSTAKFRPKEISTVVTSPTKKEMHPYKVSSPGANYIQSKSESKNKMMATPTPKENPKKITNHTMTDFKDAERKNNAEYINLNLKRRSSVKGTANPLAVQKEIQHLQQRMNMTPTPADKLANNPVNRRNNSITPQRGIENNISNTPKPKNKSPEKRATTPMKSRTATKNKPTVAEMHANMVKHQENLARERASVLNDRDKLYYDILEKLSKEKNFL